MIENSNLKLEQSEGLKCGYGLNWYAYANNNPLRFVDPSGLESADAAYSRDVQLGDKYERADQAFQNWVDSKPNERVGIAFDNPDNKTLPVTDKFQNGLMYRAAQGEDLSLLSLDDLDAAYTQELTEQMQGYGLASGVLIGGGARALDKNAVSSSYKGTQYGPLNKGPLSDDIANTFRSSTYNKITTNKPTTLYRVISPEGNPAGNYWTRTPPKGPTQSIIDSALNPQWGNNATNQVQAIIPKGTTFFEGAAASQGGLAGGGNQIYIPKVDSNWIQGITEF